MTATLERLELHAAAPQSGEDVASVLRGLRELDPRFGIRWEPRAVMVERGSYDPLGKVVEPKYRGLWEITLDDKTFGTANWRSWTRVCFVTKPVEVAAGLTAMAQDGEYAPLGEWVVQFMREADRHNQREVERRRKRLDDMNERADNRAMAAGDDATEEAASKQYHAGTKAGGGVSEFHPVKIEIVSR